MFISLCHKTLQGFHSVLLSHCLDSSLTLRVSIEKKKTTKKRSTEQLDLHSNSHMLNNITARIVTLFTNTAATVILLFHLNSFKHTCAVETPIAGD